MEKLYFLTGHSLQNNPLFETVLQVEAVYYNVICADCYKHTPYQITSLLDIPRWS